jgi:hypothetical protein
VIKKVSYKIKTPANTPAVLPPSFRPCNPCPRSETLAGFTSPRNLYRNPSVSTGF